MHSKKDPTQPKINKFFKKLIHSDKENQWKEGGRLTQRSMKESGGGDENVINLDYSDGYPGVYICQNSSNYTIYNKYILLYGSYTLVKLISLRNLLTLPPPATNLFLFSHS